MILFLVDLPNPMHGMSSINQKMLRLYQSQGSSCVVINTVPSYAARLFGTKWWGGIKVLHTVVVWFRLLYCLIWQRPSVVYRSLNGGSGQVYDLLYMSLLRYSNAQLVLHHHSFSYLHRSSGLFHLICHLLKPKDRHIVLGESMRNELVERYSLLRENILLISNLSFFSHSTSGAAFDGPGKVLQVAHLANLSFEKGVQSFVETLVAMVEGGLTVQGRLAGPCSSPQVAEYVDRVCRKYTFLKYYGPIYGDKKTLFFQETDIFVFPSRYVNEAEPLVLYEAAQHGAFLAGTPRGCMADQIIRFGGYCYSEQAVPEEVAAQLKLLFDLEAFNRSAKEERLQLFLKEQYVAYNNLELFVQNLKDGYVPEFENI